MALPRISIQYLNGQLGTAPESQDNLLCLVVLGASAVSTTFALGTPYKIYGMSSLDALGVSETNNARLYGIVSDFYSEAEAGTPLYIVGYASTLSMASFCDKTAGKIVSLVEELKGTVRGLVIAGGSDDQATEGLSPDVLDAVPLAQQAADHLADNVYAPVFVILEGRKFTASQLSSLPDLANHVYDRVAVFVGDTEANSGNAAVGLLAGRIASVPVQRNIGAVKDGALGAESMYLGGTLVDQSMDTVRALHDKGFITPRIHIGRTGYYFADDVMCCKPTEDYAHLTARRTMDKVARVAYATLLDYLLDEFEVNDDGTMLQPVIKDMQATVETSVDSQMTANGELSAVDGRGCRCFIDPDQDVVSTGRVEAVIKARPFGYGREIVAKIGFLTTNNA